MAEVLNIKNMKLAAAIAAGACVIGGNAKPVMAADASPLAGVEVSGYVDTYYQSNFNGRLNSGGRLFGARNGVIQLNMAELSVDKKKGAAKFHIDLAGGESVDALSPRMTSTTVVGTGTSAQTVVSSSSADPTRYVPQAYLSYTPASMDDMVTITVGKFYTHMGLEVARAKDNFNYTRGYIYNYGIPLWHQGASVAVKAVPEMLNVSVYALNGWDGRMAVNDSSSTTRALTWGGNVSFIGVHGLTVNYNLITGSQKQDSGSARTVHEVNATYNIMDNFAVAIDAIFGSEAKAINKNSDANWNGQAIYAKYGAMDGLDIVARYEMYDDSDRGYTVLGGYAAAGTRIKVTSITGGVNYRLGDGVETRLEYRTDSTDRSSALLVDDKGAAKDNEQAINIALLANF